MNKTNILEPDISIKEINLVNKTLKKNQISAFGDFPRLASKKISKISNSKYVTLTSSGSAALLLAIKSLSLREGDLIITSNYTFIATINSIIHTNCKPWIFDINQKDYSIDLDKLEKTLKEQLIKKGKYFYHKKLRQRVSCIMPVFFCGITPDIKRLSKISKKYNLKIINDCAGSFFSLANDKSIIKYSDISITSFNGNKSITSGAGGAILTNNKSYYKKFDKLVDNSKMNRKYLHSDFGFNYKMSSLHSAILLGQLNRFKEILKKKKIIRNYYSKYLKSDKFSFIDNEKLLWINLIKLKKIKDKKKFLKELNKKIRIEEFWISMNNQKKIKKKMIIQNFNVSNEISKKIIAIPSSSFLSRDNLKYIVKILNSFN